MSVLGEKSEAMRLLSGLENGSMNTADAYAIAVKRDPILVYFIVRYLRETYKNDQQSGSAVLNRLIDLTGTYADIQKMIRQAEADVMVSWFNDTHDIKQFRGKPGEYIDLIVDKLEG